MKFLKIGLGALVLLVLVLVVAAPIGPLPGFFIGGKAVAAPTTWPDTAGIHEIRLKVPGTLPRVVIIWVVEHDGDLYVLGFPDSGWVTRIGDGASVEMRLGDNTYSLVASPVPGNPEAILTAYADKYRPDYPDIVGDFPDFEEASRNFAIFRLDRS